MSERHPDPDPTPLERGREALARAAWEEGVEALETAVAETPEDADAWEALGTARMWLQETDRAIEARQRAYELYRERGDDLSSARLALDLANDFLEGRGEPAVANGWFQRARRLLDGLPPSGEHAMVKVWDAYLALLDEGDPVAAERHAAQGVRIAEEAGTTDVGLLALALQGLARVGEGRVRDGLDLLDEAVAGAIGGEVTDPQWFHLACCCMIDACDQVRDYGRSLEWCHRLREFCRRWRVQAFLTTCRIKYTGALLWRGEWEACEAELEQAAAELEATRPAAVKGALVRLAELRRRQGRRDEAEDLLARSKGHPLAPSVEAALALDAGDPAGALEILQVLVRRTHENARTGRVSTLELRARAHAALGEVEAAREAARELTTIAEVLDTPAIRAAALAALGVAAGAESKHEEARRCLEDALGLLQTQGAPYEEARVRLDLAGPLAALDRIPAALREARAAREALEALGARGEGERARELLRDLESAGHRDGDAGDPAGAGRGGGAGPLTRRQREVLSLVAEGLSDREIAARLYLSEHTVHRHVANIMARLGSSSRAQAVARGVRDKLI